MEFTFLWEQAIVKETSNIFLVSHEENKSSNVAEGDWIMDLYVGG